ncbi:MAG: response regulator [Spirochaetes bacterium]|nr:response regulator [Spirochaetota bacterium]
MDRKILIIDDEKSVGTILRFNLGQSGYSVLSTQDPTAGLQLAQNQKFDLFILDVAIPGINGIEICSHLRNMPQYKDTPILMISSRTDTETKNAARNAGANEYIAKPFPFEKLADKVKEYLPLFFE